LAYTSKNGRKPMEMASKTSHSYIIRHALVQEFLQACNIPQPADSEVVSLQVVPVEPPIEDNIRLVITIDGGFTEVVESQLPLASNGDYFGRKRLSGNIPEKLNKKRQLRRYGPTITA
jgi:hypothetical protein